MYAVGSTSNIAMAVSTKNAVASAITAYGASKKVRLTSDNLITHVPASLYKAFPAKEARDSRGYIKA